MKPYVDHLDEITLQEYAETVLPPEQQSRIDAHLAHCELCRDRLAEVHALLAELTEVAMVPDAPVSRDLTPAIMAALSPQPAQRLPWPWLVGQLLLATALLYAMGPAAWQRLLQRTTPALASAASWAQWLQGFGSTIDPAWIQLQQTLHFLVDPWLWVWSNRGQGSFAPDLLPVWWGAILIGAIGIWLVVNRLALMAAAEKGERRG